MTVKLNKWWLIPAALVLVTWIGVGTVWSYLSTAGSEIERTMRDAVPVGFELKRLETMTAELIPEIQANQKVAAQLDVEVEYLQREIESMQQSQGEAQAEMKKLRDALRDDRDSFTFAGRDFTRADVEADLDRRLARFEDDRLRLEAKQRILKSRGQTLAAATDKIRQYQQQHQLLVEKSEALHAELKLLELAQANGNFEFDQNKLSQTKDLAMQVEKRIRTLQRLVEGQEIAGEIPVEVDQRSAAEKFDEYFVGK